MRRKQLIQFGFHYLTYTIASSPHFSKNSFSLMIALITTEIHLKYSEGGGFKLERLFVELNRNKLL